MTLELYKNTFVSLEDADVYFDERFGSDKWTDESQKINNETKEKLLITASRKISALDFVGSPLDVGQKMAFPRNFDLPQDVKDAVCEEAYALLTHSEDMHRFNQDNNISSISLGVGSISYNQTGLNTLESILISKEAQRLVGKWLKKGFLINC